jgi:DNA-binding beta-propeller fold protein YncE
VVTSNGAYSGKVYVGGLSYLLTGTFNAAGSSSAIVVRTNAGLSDLAVVLQLDSSNGTSQMTGSVSSTTEGLAWTSPLLGEPATNAYPLLTGASLQITPEASTNAPTVVGNATCMITNSVLSLAGTMGDTETISQSAPISMAGNVPIYINLYTNGGLLEGWINVTGGAATGNLTWIRPAGVLQPPGFPQGFDTLAQVTGVTYTQGVGYFWVVDGDNNRVEMFNSSGVYLSQFGSYGSGGGQFNGPIGMAQDPAGHLWVVDYSNNRLEEFSSTGAYLAQVGSAGAAFGQLSGPRGIAIDATGNLWVADSGNNRVEEFSNGGACLFLFGAAGSSPAQMQSPRGIAVDALGNIWVTDSGNNRVSEFNRLGVCLLQFGSWGAGPGQMENPRAIAIDSDGNVWIVDNGNNRVEKFSNTGAFLMQIGSLGAGNGQFNGPTWASFDSGGNFWVADSGNNRVQEFSSSGAYLWQFGSAGAGNGQFNAPYGLALH